MQTATAAYFEDQDVFGQWLGECTRAGEGRWEATGKLYASWGAYAVRHGEQTGSARAFNGLLQKRGYRADKGTAGMRIFRGLDIKLAALDPDQGYAVRETGDAWS
jgi:putative DNA primase/helicase